MSTSEDYPEHDKLRLISEQSQVCGEFIDWLDDEKDISLCARQRNGDYWPDHTNIQDLLAQFFDIDQDKLEQEKMAMLARLRNEN